MLLHNQASRRGWNTAASPAAGTISIGEIFQQKRSSRIPIAARPKLPPDTDDDDKEEEEKHDE